MRTTNLLISLAVISSIAGCGGDQGESTPITFEGNITTWAMPLDSYLPNPPYQEYGQRAFLHSCLTGKGFRDTLIDPRGFIPATYSSRMRSLFSVELAAKYGYRGGDAPLDASAGDEVPPSSKAEERARSQCAQAAAKVLDTLNPIRAEIEGLGGAAYTGSLKEPEVLEAGRRWRECMLPLGVPDLPESPTAGQIPTDTQRVRFGTTDRTRKAPPVRAVEIKEAVFDATCRATSGWTEAVYKAEVRLQLELANDNRSLLDRAAEYTAESNKATRDAVEAAGGDAAQE